MGPKIAAQSADLAWPWQAWIGASPSRLMAHCRCPTMPAARFGGSLEATDSAQGPRLTLFRCCSIWLATTANTAALIADYDRYAVNEPQKLIGRTLRLTAGICARDQRQLIPQLLGRLMTNANVGATG